MNPIMPRMVSASDVLAYIDWVWLLQWREAQRADPTIGWQPDMSWDELGNFGARVQVPGEVETKDEIDQYLPEYVGLLDAQLYWPARPPAIDPASA